MLEEKLTMIKKLEQGEYPTSIARSYSMNKASIFTIWKNAEKIKEAIAEATQFWKSLHPMCEILCLKRWIRCCQYG